MQVRTESNFNAGNAPGIGLDSSSKIQLLENELAEALEANDMYKAQLKRSVQVLFAFSCTII